jgi:hypothetical protein
MPKARLSISCLGAIVFFGAAASAPAQERSDSQVVVTGRRDLDQEVSDFVAALTPRSKSGQLSRFEDEVCPGALGFDPDVRAAIVERMRRVASAAGVRIGAKSCLPNALLLATRDKKALIETLASRYPAFLVGLSTSEVRRLAESPGPAAAWQILGQPRSADGIELPIDDSGSGRAVSINRTSRQPSRITHGGRRATAGAVVVIEHAGMDGLSVAQVADYATMRTLLRADPVKLATSKAPSILHAVEAPMGSEVPLSLTRWDMGVLRAQYRTRPDLHATAQRSAIRRDLGETLVSDRPAD